jgi:hypothetical protein
MIQSGGARADLGISGSAGAQQNPISSYNAMDSTAIIFYTEPIATPTRWVRERPYVWSGARRFHRAFLPGNSPAACRQRQSRAVGMGFINNK